MKTYTVTGTQPVLDHEPGEEFQAELGEEQERLLLEGGAIAVADGGKGEEPAAPPNVGDLDAAQLAAVIQNDTATFPQAGELEVPAAEAELRKRGKNGDTDAQRALTVLGINDRAKSSGDTKE